MTLSQPPSTDEVVVKIAQDVLTRNIRDGDIYWWWASGQECALAVLRLSIRVGQLEDGLHEAEAELTKCKKELARVNATTYSASEALRHEAAMAPETD